MRPPRPRRTRRGSTRIRAAFRGAVRNAGASVKLKRAAAGKARSSIDYASLDELQDCSRG